jgi:ATP-binding cassette, subfamily B, bacterial
MKKFWQTTRRAIAFAWKTSPLLYFCRLVLQILQGVLPLANAYLAGRIINLVVNYLVHHTGSTTSIFILTALVASLSFIGQLLANLDRYWSSITDYRFDMHLQQSLFSQFQRLDQSYYEDPAFNTQLAKVDENRYAILQFSNNLFQLATSLVTLTVAAGALIILNPLLLIVLAISVAPVVIIESRTSLDRWRRWDIIGDDWRLMWNSRTTLLNPEMVKEIKMTGIYDHMVGLWRMFFKRFKEMDVSIERRALKHRSGAAILSGVVELGVDVWLLLKVLGRGSQFGLGDFQFYRQVVSNFSGALTSLSTSYQRLQDNQRYIEDIFNLLALEPRVVEPAQAISLAAGEIPVIEIKNISFRYPRTKNYIFKDFSMVIKPGEAVAIVGENGAGKTTLIKLLMRFYDVDEGEILVNGHNIKELKLSDWYRHIGVLFQDFNHYGYLSVGDNIKLGDIHDYKNSNRMLRASKSAGANAFIERYDKKYNQILDRSFPDGIEPSGGQWQRIALARAFFRNAGILVLDEPTSAIDARGEYEIFKQINETQKDKTTIIISHRFSTVRNADHIYVMDKGRLIEHGDHHSLIKIKDGHYRGLFELQAEGYR